MKTHTKLATLAALALMASAAHAESLSGKSTAQTTSASPMQDTISNEKVKEPANVKGGASMDTTSAYSETQPQAGDDMSADTSAMGSAVKVRLPDGKVISVNDSADTPWNRSEELKGYDRFTFDPVNNVFVAGKGDKEFDNNWDDKGNRIVKVIKKAPKKVEVVADENATIETTTEETTTVETTTPAETTEEAPAEPAAH